MIVHASIKDTNVLLDAHAQPKAPAHASLRRLTYASPSYCPASRERRILTKASPSGTSDDSSNSRRNETNRSGFRDRAVNPLLDRDDDFQELNRQRTRLADALLAMPSKLDNYFDGGPGPYRRIIWLCIAFLSGYYSANVVSLSFGALAINDVVAAVVTVGFCEVTSYAYWSADRPGFQIVLTQAFKLGITAALITDALKLQS